MNRTPGRLTTAAHAGRWLLPWLCVLLVSGSFAHAMEQALTPAWHEPAVPRARALDAGDPIAATPAAGCAARDGGPQHVGLNPGIPADLHGKPCLRPSANPGSRWVGIEAAALEGRARRLTCLTRADRVSTDVLAVPAEDLDTVVADLCADAAVTSAGVAFAELSLRHSVAILPMGASACCGEGAADGQARVNTQHERPREAVRPAVAHTRNGRSFRHDDAIELFRMQVGEQSTRVCHAVPLARRPVARP